MYWTDVESMKIRRANLDGSEPEDIVTSEIFSPGQLFIDTGCGALDYQPNGIGDECEVDSDGDDVIDDCDLCPGEDDRIDMDVNGTPDCLESAPIPTISGWGNLVLTLLLVTAWKVYYSKRQST